MMTAPVEPILRIPGSAADHLYREGSSKASFWEVLFGSRLAAEKRTQVTSLGDGTRRFDVPVASIEDSVLANAGRWMAAQASGGNDGGFKAAAAALASKGIRLSLVGLQPRGVAVASFALSVEPTQGVPPSQEMAEAFQSWFAAERTPLLAILVPFGFTPH